MAKNKFEMGDHIYIQVADGLEKMISDEVLRIGDKLPSVRVLSGEYGISTGTAFQAYYHLEGKGLIESRPKSGYYVRFNHKRFPAVAYAQTTLMHRRTM
jgi:DNA-binding transcriptional regulator YhcF (GntR family)